MHSMTRHSSVVLHLGALAAIVLGAACSGDSTGVAGNTANQIAFRASTSAASGAAAALVPVTKNGHTLDLSSVTLTIARAELKRAKSDDCPGDHDNDDEHPAASQSTASCGELRIGPTTVDLPLTGSLMSIPANTIPSGTFREFELRVSQVELKGTFDGKAFDVMVPVHVKSEIEFSTPLVVTDNTPTSITVDVPVADWLVASDGSLIDPSTLQTSPSLMQQVVRHISASFHAFDDKDHNGRDDHDEGGDHGGDHG